MSSSRASSLASAAWTSARASNQMPRPSPQAVLPQAMPSPTLDEHTPDLLSARQKRLSRAARFGFTQSAGGPVELPSYWSEAVDHLVQGKSESVVLTDRNSCLRRGRQIGITPGLPSKPPRLVVQVSLASTVLPASFDNHLSDTVCFSALSSTADPWQTRPRSGGRGCCSPLDAKPYYRVRMWCWRRSVGGSFHLRRWPTWDPLVPRIRFARSSSALRCRDRYLVRHGLVAVTRFLAKVSGPYKQHIHLGLCPGHPQELQDVVSICGAAPR